MLGEVAGSWKPFGGAGALLTILAHLLELPLTHGVATAYRVEKAQDNSRRQIGRGRGDLETIIEVLAKVSRERLATCASDQWNEA